MASKRKFNSDCENKQPNKKTKFDAPRAFQESWKIGKTWLKYDNETKSMLCNLCLKHKKTNSFTSGCTVLKKDSVSKHSKCKGNWPYLFMKTFSCELFAE
jgi:hypothetical protein